MAPAKVIVVGAGIAGPILAIFLKLRGYEPILYERLEGVQQAGLSLMLQPNGLRVLSQIPGFIQTIPGKAIERMVFRSTVEEDLVALGENDIPSRLPSAYGHGMFGVQRTAFHRAIVDAAVAHGIQIHWGHTLVSLEQSEDHVKVVFENGSDDTGSFVVGCDGLHSGTRIALFGKEKADFTGLCQTGGLSPTPEVLKAHASHTNWFGNAAHMVAYPISDTHTSWAVTTREAESKETWGTVNIQTAQDFMRSPVSNWGQGAGELVKTTERVIKYGLYDRPELRSWFKGRVVLLGDAAHPTSPHLGQGANQAFEDVQKLISLLDQHNAERTSPTTSILDTVFRAFESARIPRCAALVKGARQEGEGRVVEGVEACLKRNLAVRDATKDDGALYATFSRRYQADEGKA